MTAERGGLLADGTLSNREFILVLVACIIVAFLGGMWRWSVHDEAIQTCEAEKLQCAKHINDCGEDLERVGQICSETARAAMTRAVQIFECEESICKANGWLAPTDRYRPPPRAWEARGE